MTRKYLLLTVVILVAGAAAILVRMHPGQADSRAAPAAPVSQQAIGIGALGRVEPESRVRKLNQSGGLNVTRLGRLLVREGDRVTAGQLLAEFADASQKDAATAQAAANVRQSEASLARINAAGRPEDVQAQRERVEAMRAAETSLARDAARSEALGPTGATAIATTLGTLASVGLVRYSLPGRALITAILLSPMIVPIVIVAVGTYFFYSTLGIANKALAAKDVGAAASATPGAARPGTRTLYRR